MRVGLTAYDIPYRELRHLATAAEDAGFGSLWLGEHIALPVGYESEHPSTEGETVQHHTGPIVDPTTHLLDPLVALAGIAEATRTLVLATGIYILPLRPPLVTARMAATLAEIAPGRVRLGVGAGWLEEEFDAVGVPYAERTSRFLESIEVLRAAWRGGPFDHSGAHWRTGPVQVSTAPVPIPLILGGNGPRALRRAAELGQGWFSSGTPTLAEAIELRDQLLAHRRRADRAGPFTISVRSHATTAAEIAPYRDAGIDEVVVWTDTVWPADGDLDHKRTQLRAAAARLGLTPGSDGPHEEHP